MVIMHSICLGTQTHALRLNLSVNCELWLLDDDTEDPAVSQKLDMALTVTWGGVITLL